MYTLTGSEEIYAMRISIYVYAMYNVQQTNDHAQAHQYMCKIIFIYFSDLA